MRILVIARNSLWEKEHATETLVARTRLKRALHHPIDQDEFELEKKRAKKDAEFAKKQVDLGFPTLLAHTTISLWSALEALIQDVALLWLKINPDALQSDRLKNIKISLADFLSLDDEQRLRRLIGEIERHKRGEGLAGVQRFEEILNAVGLGGRVSKELSKTLYELSRVRNLIIHKGGMVDVEFLNACPWFQIKEGHEFRVDTDSIIKYSDGVREYSKLIWRRIARKYKRK